MSDQGPALPQRPKSPFNAQLEELKQAFPDAETNVCRAILVAASGNLENAFNGLLALTDESIRPAPPQQVIDSREQQLRKDEELARRLATPRAPRGQQRYRDDPRDAPRGDADDISIDEIRDNLQKWGNEASKNIGSFFNNIKTRIQTEFQQEEPDEDYYGRPDPLHRGTTRADAYRQVQQNRRADSPHFVEMNDEQAPAPPPKPSRPTTNAQKVNAFGEDKPARWEPIRSTAGSDAFFIGESDEEVDSINEEPTKPKDEGAKPKPIAKDDDPKATKEVKKVVDEEAKKPKKPDTADSKGEKADSKESTETKDTEQAVEAKVEKAGDESTKST